MRLLQSTAIAASLLATQVLAASSTLPNLGTKTATQATNTRFTNTNTQNTIVTTSAVSSSVVLTSSSSAAQVTSAASSPTDDGALTGLPTLTGGFVIVAPSVPPTTNAPYMQASKLPEGTVFIAVGAILGFLAMSVLLWRTMVAWALHRSVNRAAMQQNMSDTKTLFGSAPAPPPPFYKYSDRDSTPSLSGLTPKGKQRGRPSTSNAAGASTSNLFFSPTAGAAGAGLANSGNRTSNYLPAGYYAAGASAAGNGQNHVPLGAGQGPSISMTNLGHHSQGYNRSRSMGPSPPDSPAFVATTGTYMGSNSTLDLNRGHGQQRPPSAYLEDMFEQDGPPVPIHHTRTDSGSSRRY
jgi:hypothetical protein